MLSLVVHPAFVHFPLAMFTSAWVCYLLAHGWDRDDWSDRGWLFERVGVWSLPVTVVAGFVDANGLKVFTDARFDLPLIWHALLSLAATAVYAVHWGWRRGRSFEEVRAAAATDIWLSTAGTWLLFASGLVAGEMVFGT